MPVESVMPSNHLILCHPLLFLPSIFPASGSFPMSRLCASGSQSIGVSASVLPMNIQGWFPLGLTSLIPLQSKGLPKGFLHLPTKVRLVKAMVFPVVMYGCESWTMKKAGSEEFDAFKLWCWRRLLRVPWTARRSNQSILKEISPQYSLEKLMLKLQYFGYLMGRTDSFEKTWCWEDLKEGGEGDDRGWDGWMASPTQWIWVWVNSGSWWWTGRPGSLLSMGSQRVGHDWVTELNWWFLSFLFHLFLLRSL